MPVLPDDVLLEMFDFYVYEGADDDIKQSIEGWIRLSHVCRRWRGVIFQSPHRLNMRLVCTPQTPTRDVLDIWPHLPLIIRDIDNNKRVRPIIEDNIIAALEHNDRVRQIQLIFPELGYFTNSAVLKPFPELTHLWLERYEDEKQEPIILPDSFLGGSAPRLESLTLEGFSFPGLPKLLLSATHLVDLDLSDIPRSGYIQPEAIATSISALTGLEKLWLRFNYPPPRPAPEIRRPPPPPLTRSILPSLTGFTFKGASEYLEAILARIETPRLYEMRLSFFNQAIFDTPQLYQFVSRRPTPRALEKGHISFESRAIIVSFTPRKSVYHKINVGIMCTASEWQLSSLEQVCTMSLPPVPTLEDLYISESDSRFLKPRWQEGVESTLWLDLLRPFIAVKNLYISVEFVPRIAPALQELVGGRTTEVFPALDNIFLEGFQPSRPVQEGIEKFIAARRLISRPVAVSHWDKKRW